MNQVYVYDGSFIMLLNLILELVKNNIKPDNIKPEIYQASLLENIIRLDVQSDFDIIYNMNKSFGKYAVHAMYYVFLSEYDKKELLLYYFFLNALKYHKKICFRRDLKCVSEVLRISDYVRHESHKLKGFLRFRELENNVLYAEIEPTNDILILLSNHFCKRLRNEFFIIKDVKRGILSIYDKKDFIIVEETAFTLSTEVLSEKEREMANLWKIFYRAIGIEARKNDRCRMTFMPKKYWRYMLEVEDEL